MNKTARAKLIGDLIKKANSADALTPDTPEKLDNGNIYGDLPKADLQLDNVQTDGAVSSEGKAQTMELNDTIPGATPMEADTASQPKDQPGITDDPKESGEGTPAFTTNNVTDPGYYESEEENDALKISEALIKQGAALTEALSRIAGVAQPQRQQQGKAATAQPQTKQSETSPEVLAIAERYKSASASLTDPEWDNAVVNHWQNRIYFAECLADKVAAALDEIGEEALAEEALADEAGGEIPVGDVGGDEALTEMGETPEEDIDMSPEMMAALEEMIADAVEEELMEQGIAEEGHAEPDGDEWMPMDDGGSEEIDPAMLATLLAEEGFNPDTMVGAMDSPEAQKMGAYRNALSRIAGKLNKGHSKKSSSRKPRSKKASQGKVSAKKLANSIGGKVARSMLQELILRSSR